MYRRELIYTETELEEAKQLADFLPDKIFDAHAHPINTDFLPLTKETTGTVILDANTYRKDMMPMLLNPRELRMNLITMPDKTMFDKNNGLIEMSDRFLIEQLETDKLCVGEIMVHPKETAEDIEKRLVHPSIKGFKCYHLLADREVTWNCNIEEYLPESAWEVANKRKMCITLHMVKDEALADPENMKYICEMSKKYPDAVLILAHAARSFAAWTGFESVEKLAHIENVWFDFSAVCESPTMFQIVRKAGVKRCMWGSDYPVCRCGGKAFSLGKGFKWIYEGDVPEELLPISLENLFAVRQMGKMAELSKSDIEDLFFYNACRLFER